VSSAALFNVAEVMPRCLGTFARRCFRSLPSGCSSSTDIIYLDKVDKHFPLDTDFLPNVLASAGAHQNQVTTDPTSSTTRIIWSISGGLSFHVAESFRSSTQIQAYPNAIHCRAG
jgi:hypothetical protein